MKRRRAVEMWRGRMELNRISIELWIAKESEGEEEGTLYK